MDRRRGKALTTPPGSLTPTVMRAIARLNVGGPARHAVILNAGLDANGFRTVLVHGTPGVDEGSFEELIVEASIRAVRVPGLGRRVSVIGDVVAFSSLLRLVFRERPDILHTHTAKAGALGRTAGFLYNCTRRRRERCLLVHTFHGHVLSGYFGPLGTALTRWSERVLAWFTDRVITISDRQRDEIVTYLRITRRGQVVVIPLGLDLEALLSIEAPDRSLRRSLGWADEDFVVGYVGRLVPIKDLPTLVSGFTAFAKNNATARLLVVGDGSLRAEIEEKVRVTGLASNVRFVGWQRNLRQVYGAMDVAALTSRNEGTPVALIEALAARVPVVATAVGGVPDVIQDGRTGVLIAPADADALAAALQRLARDRVWRAEMADRGRRDVQRRFASRRLVEDILALYSELLASRATGG
jgi:glycosyltransferase involved in cell wall biosynthesis